jgi:hypothetical protein
MGTRPQLVVVSGLSIRIPLTVGFRPQLVVVFGLSMGIPLMVGFRPQLVVVFGLSVGIPLTEGFRLSRSHWLSWSPFTIFPFSRWNFGYHEAFHELFFQTMEFWLSRSLSQTFLSNDGILAIKAFHELFFQTMEFWLLRSLSRIFLSHDGILAITEPLTNFSFTRWNLGYHEAFHELFLWWNSQVT